MPLTLRQECEAGYDKLLEIAMRITQGKEEAARDLVGDGVCKALEYEDKYKQGSTFFGWMFFIMRGVYLKQVGRRTEANTVYTDKPIDSFEGWEDRVTMPCDARYIDLEEAMSALSESELECIVLQMHGYSCREIGRHFGVPVGTIKRRLFDIRNKIRGFYDEGQGNKAPSSDGPPGPCVRPGKHVSHTGTPPAAR